MLQLRSMKRVVLFFLTLMVSWGALAFSPDQYALQVLQKDLPRSLRWFGLMAQADQLSQVEVYELYRGALPETQENQQVGISVKGSMDRMILLLEGARYFEQVQKAPIEFQNKKEVILRILQVSKDEMDRFQFGEDPQVLLDEWRSLGVMDFEKFTADLVETYAELQRLLNEPVMVAVEQKVDAQVQPEQTPESESAVEAVEVAGADFSSEDNSEDAVATESAESAEPVNAEPAMSEAIVAAAVPQPEPTPANPAEVNFEKQRFNSYIQSAEAGVIADECQGALFWKTDQAESCQSDESLECDRNYARQCKKLQ